MSQKKFITLYTFSTQLGTQYSKIKYAINQINFLNFKLFLKLKDSLKKFKYELCFT